MFSQTEIREIVDKIKYHYSLMMFTSLGDEALTDEDRLLLEQNGVNVEALRLEYPPYMQMFLLGRLTAILRDPQAMQITPKDFRRYIDRGQFIPLSEREREEYRISREMTYGHLKGLANKVVGEARDRVLEQNKMQLIGQVISEGVRNRKSIQQIVSELGHRTGEWDRDWRRIVVTEMQNIYNQGRASMYREKFGDETMVWKQVFPLACRHCIRLYLTRGLGSEPRIFSLAELTANGTNIGRSVPEWLPVVGATHPHCRCDIRSVHKGQRWNPDTGAFEYVGGPERRVERKSKVKVTVGEKVFFV